MEKHDAPHRGRPVAARKSSGLRPEEPGERPSGRSRKLLKQTDTGLHAALWQPAATSQQAAEDQSGYLRQRASHCARGVLPMSKHAGEDERSAARWKYDDRAEQLARPQTHGDTRDVSRRDRLSTCLQQLAIPLWGHRLGAAQEAGPVGAAGWVNGGIRSGAVGGERGRLGWARVLLAPLMTTHSPRSPSQSSATNDGRQALGRL